MDYSDSDEEHYFKRRKQRLEQEQQEQKQQARPRNTWGGSKKGKRANVQRDRVQYHELLMKDYFVENPVYDAKTFCRRFRMRRELFQRIKQDLLQHHNETWKQSQDSLGVAGFSTEQKMTGCLRLLAYGSARTALMSMFEWDEDDHAWNTNFTQQEEQHISSSKYKKKTQ
jgi:hypothetical protein